MDNPRTYNPDRVRLARTAKRLGQQEVADALDVGRSAVSGWEAPRDADHARTPTPENLGKLADLLLDGRGVDYFYGQGSPL